MLVKYPVLTIVGGFSMAFAIWVGAGTFEAIRQLVFPMIPLPDADRIVMLQNWDASANRPELRATHDFVAWRGSVQSDVPGIGRGGETRGRAFVIPAVLLKPFTFLGPMVHIGSDTSRFGGVVGGEFLRHFDVTFDYAGSRLGLARSDTGSITTSRDRSGLTLVATGHGFDSIVVHDVAAGSPGADAGIAKGDVIVEIDSSPASALRLSGVIDRLTRSRPVVVRLVHGGDPRTTSLDLSRDYLLPRPQ